MVERGSILRRFGGLCLVAAATVPAWRFGGVQSIDQLWILAILGIAALSLLFASVLNRDEPLPRLPKVIWPIGLAIAIGWIQLAALPNSWHQWLSPKGLEWWSELSIDQPAAEETFTLSLYPASTRLNLAALAFGACAFLLASSFQNQRRLAIWGLTLCAVNGAATGLFGIAQLLTFNGKLYWTIPLTQGGSPFAAFVNQNHAAGYLNLCLACGIGLFVYCAADKDDGERNGHSNGKHHERWLYDSKRQEWQLLAVGALCILVAAAIICTTSRGGVLATIVAFFTVVVLDARLRSKSSFRLMVGAIILGGTGLAVWLGRGLYLHSRFQNIWSHDRFVQNGRLSHWADALRASADFWLTGTGLGTYRFAYRPYETSFTEGWYFHAENHYIEALLESGIPGLLVMLLAIWFCYRAIHIRRKSHDPVSLALGTAGLFGLTAQAFHACFDFGLYMPANAIFFGALMGCAGASRPELRRTRAMWAILFAAVIGWTSWSFVETNGQYEFDCLQKSYRDFGSQSPTQKMATTIPTPNASPIHAEERFLNARLGMMNYQMSTFDELRTHASTKDTSLLWRLSDSRVLHQRAHQIATEGNVDALRQLVESPQVKHSLSTAYDELVQARSECPLLPRVHLGLAQLGVIFGDEQFEERRIRNTEVLAPFVPDVLFKSGLLDLQAGRIESGFQRWQRCLLLSPRYIDQVMQIAASVISTEELFERVLPRSADRLIQIADSYFSNAEASTNRVKLAGMAETALDSEKSIPAARRFKLEGQIFRLKGQKVQAIDNLASAIALSPRDVATRYDLANLLLEVGRLGEALHHATICRQLDPKPRKHQALLRDIRGRMSKQMERK